MILRISGWISFGETGKQGNVESPGKVCSHIFAVRFWHCVHHFLEEQGSVLEPGLEYPIPILQLLFDECKG